MSAPGRALSASLATCHTCALLMRLPPRTHALGCPRCGHPVHARKQNSLRRTWALVAAGAILYVPANLLPITSVTHLGSGRTDTIMSGVMHLLHTGMWPLALIVFVASVFVPLAKLLALVLLLVSVQRGWTWRPVQRTRLYRLTEMVGRWSMVDIYVVTILAALVNAGALARVEPRPGAVFFGLVVVLTMLAAESFDPRLIWDRLGRAVAEREEEAGREAEHEDVPEAQVREKSRLSAVWLIPLVAAAVGGWLTWKSISGMGPTITIRFDNAEGLEAGKTKIKFREFELGVIEELTLADDLGSVVATAQLKPIAEPYMTDKTRFWVVRARVTASRVTGLDTLISGAYVGVDPVEDGNPTETFEALERAPVVTSREEGRSFVLIAPGRGSINPGAPVYHRQVDVGEVVHAELDPARDLVRFDVFVRAPHDQQVRENTRFWNASGIDASVDETGLRIHTESVVAMLVGGVGFDTPADDVGERAEEGTSFDLFPSKQATEVPVFPLKVRYLTYFEGSVRGLSVGAPVEFRGIRIGQVADVSLQFDGGDFRIPVVLEIEPGRVKTPRDDDAAVVKRLEALVDEGLRAQLRTGNLLTGQLVVTLSMHPDAPPATITRGGEHPVLPSVPSQLEALTDQLQALVDKIDGLPMEGIAKELERSMGALRETLGQTGDLAGSVQSDLVPAMTRTMNEAEKSLASVREVMGGVEALIGPRAPAVVELQRLLDEGTAALRAVRLLADHLERNPEDLIRGRSEP